LTLKDAIGSHACPLEAGRRVTNGIPLGRLLLLPVGTVNCVQTLKVWHPSEPTKLAVGSSDPSAAVVQFWDLRNRDRPYAEVAPHTSGAGVACLDWSVSDATRFISASTDGSVLSWNPLEEAPVTTHLLSSSGANVGIDWVGFCPTNAHQFVALSADGLHEFDSTNPTATTVVHASTAGGGSAASGADTGAVAAATTTTTTIAAPVRCSVLDGIMCSRLLSDLTLA
jgi:WD40 repeat protein